MSLRPKYVRYLSWFRIFSPPFRTKIAQWLSLTIIQSFKLCSRTKKECGRTTLLPPLCFNKLDFIPNAIKSETIYNFIWIGLHSISYKKSSGVTSGDRAGGDSDLPVEKCANASASRQYSQHPFVTCDRIPQEHQHLWRRHEHHLLPAYQLNS